MSSSSSSPTKMLLLAVLLSLPLLRAFSPTARMNIGSPPSRMPARSSGSELRMVWSSFPSPPNMWYTVENHVTRRRTIYDESEPLEHKYKFAMPRDDWFRLEDDGRYEAAAAAAASRLSSPELSIVRRMNPLRQAARWAKKGRNSLRRNNLRRS